MSECAHKVVSWVEVSLPWPAPSPHRILETQFGQAWPAALGHRVWMARADRAEEVPVVAECPHVHVDSRGIWACCALEGEQQRTSF